MLEVEAGRADGCVIEIYLAMPFAAQHPNTKVLAHPDEAKGLLAREWGCIPVRKDEHSFMHYLDQWVPGIGSGVPCLRCTTGLWAPPYGAK